jgi:hypothetical protein
MKKVKNSISEQSPILLTGCARSGTSLMAGIVNICGAFGGVMSGPNKYNQKGMFENAHIRDIIEKGYLRKIGMDPLGQKPLPNTDNLMIPNNWKEDVEKVMLNEGYKDGPWFYKGAKACLIWPVWNLAFPNAKWIIVRRRSADIADSCLNTAFMRAYDTYEGWISWINHHEDKFIEMFTSGLNVKQVWPERMLNGNYEQAREAIEWLGLKWNREKVVAHIEPKLWKAASKQGL